MSLPSSSVGTPRAASTAAVIGASAAIDRSMLTTSGPKLASGKRGTVHNSAVAR